MSPLPTDELLAPLADAEPCGADLVYAPEFDALLTAAQGKPERQTGDVVVPAEPPQWPAVHEAALALARRTRDLRLAVLLARAGAHIRGLAGYADGLALVAGLLERYWDHVHPQLDADDDGDATMRLFALAPLCDAATGLAELRACTAAGPRHPVTMRMIELAWTKAELAKGEARPTQPALADGLRDLAKSDAALLDRMHALHATALAIEKTVSQRAGTAGPDFKPLLRLTGAIADAAAVAAGTTAANAPADGGSDSAAASTTAVSVPGQIGSREDVVRTLGAVCDWIERHEPTNPAPLLIRRAQRLMSKSFIDLVRDLAPDGLTQVERIAGVAAET